jgi:predicted enzyme related to lactoylglutathione lyase
MPERDGYIPGVPCWVDASEPDPEAALDYYSGLFGWEFQDVIPPNSEGNYFIARGEARGSSIFDLSGDKHGGDVAAVRSIPEASPPTAMWNTYFWVNSADEAASKVHDAGGDIVREPFNFMDVCRMAVFTDPEGAAFGVWEARQHKGARLVNDPAPWSSTASTPVTSQARGRSTDRCSAGRRARSAAGLRGGRFPVTASGSSASTTRACASRWRTQGRRRASRT